MSAPPKQSSEAVRKFAPRDWWVALAVFTIAFGLHVPFRSRWVYHWDGAQLALAIGEYNVSLNQPHAPGYILYVMVGRLVNFVVGDPHASLVWMSLAFGGGLSAVLYCLGAAMFGRRMGLTVALLSITSPQVWFHSCVALMYVVDAFWVCVTVLWCWWAMERGGSWLHAMGIGILLAVVGGVRQQTAPALVPLMVVTLCSSEQARFARLTVAALIAAALSAAWFVPMVELSGGLSSYLEEMRKIAIITRSQTLLGGGLRALVWNLTLVGAFCWNGLLLGAVILAGGLVYRTFRMDAERKRQWDQQNRRAIWMLALWIGPMMIMGTIVAFTEQPGHVLGYLTALLFLVALVVSQARSRSLFLAATGAVCVVNIMAFVTWPPGWDGVLLGVGRTAREIRRHDEELGQTVQAIRSQFDPAVIVVCHALTAHYLFGLRHFQLHLPEFDHYQMQPDPPAIRFPNRPILSARGGRTVYCSRIDWSGKRIALLVVPPGQQLGIFKRYFDVTNASSVPGAEGKLYALPVNGLQQ